MFLGKKIISLSLGTSHTLALTEQGEIYGWGKNKLKQINDSFEPYITLPTLVSSFKGQNILGFCCGPNQNFVWSDFSSYVPQSRVPFVIDLTDQTFRLIDNLLDVSYDDILFFSFILCLYFRLFVTTLSILLRI